VLPTRRKGLRTPEDLPKLDDSKLMEAANKIQLINDVGFKQLDHIRLGGRLVPPGWGPSGVVFALS
jgi:hypothetical protein